MKCEVCLEAPAIAEASAREFSLAEGEVLNLGRGARTIRVLSGVAWVTQEGDAQDHVLNRCDDVVLARDGLVVVQSLTPRVRLEVL